MALGQRFAHIGIDGAVTRKNTAVRAAIHDNQHYEPRSVAQPWLSTQRLQNAINFLRIELACQKIGSVICALFVANCFSLKSVTIGKRRNILSCAGGESLKPAVAHDASVARHFDKNVFKTKLEAERSISFILPGNHRARRVDIVKAVRLRDRGLSRVNDESA
jgi:hypothetical protein